MKRRWQIATVCISLMLFAAGCGSQTAKEESDSQTEHTEETKEKEETPEEAAEAAKQAKLGEISPSAYGNIEGLDLEPGTYFSVIGKSESEEYWSQVKAGAEAAVSDLNEALGYEGSDKIKVVYSGPKESDDVDEQVNILDEEMARYPSALAIAIIDSQSGNVQFDLAAQNGIPVVTFDSESSYQGIMAHVTTDNTKAATETAVHMAEALEEEGQVLIISHDSKSMTSQERVDGFVSEIQNNHPGMSVTETYYMDDLDAFRRTIAMERAGITASGETSSGEGAGTENGGTEGGTGETEQAVTDEEIQAVTDEEVYEYIFEQNPEVRGIYATNGECVTLMAELCEQKELDDIVIMGYDADAEEIQALEDGRVAGLIVQNPYGMGYATIVAEARSVLSLGNEAVVDTGYTWVTSENLEEKEVQRMLYVE